MALRQILSSQEAVLPSFQKDAQLVDYTLAPVPKSTTVPIVSHLVRVSPLCPISFGSVIRFDLNEYDSVGALYVRWSIVSNVSDPFTLPTFPGFNLVESYRISHGSNVLYEVLDYQAMISALLSRIPKGEKDIITHASQGEYGPDVIQRDGVGFLTPIVFAFDPLVGGRGTFLDQLSISGPLRIEIKLRTAATFYGTNTVLDSTIPPHNMELSNTVLVP